MTVTTMTNPYDQCVMFLWLYYHQTGTNGFVRDYKLGNGTSWKPSYQHKNFQTVISTLNHLIRVAYMSRITQITDL